MPNDIQLFGADGNAPFSVTELLINLAIGLVLAVVVRWHFLKFGSTLSNRDELGGVLPFVLMTTVLIIASRCARCMRSRLVIRHRSS